MNQSFLPRVRATLAVMALAALAACGSSSSGGLDAGGVGNIGTAKNGDSIGHVFVIVMENKSYDLTFGPNTAAPYLGQELPKKGVLLQNYYSIGHNSLTNYIALISGQAPNPDTQADCMVAYSDFTGTPQIISGLINGSGCVYPASVASLPDELRAAGISWKGYMQDMGNDPSRYDPALSASSARPQGPRTCGRPALNTQDKTQSASATDQYAARHDPFVYFHSVIDDQPYCDERVVNLDDAFANDLKSIDTTPAFSFLTPNLCDDGHDANCADGAVGGLTGIDRYLKKWVPVIVGSPAFQKDGLLIIVYDESTSFQDDSSGCCGQTAAGTNGTLAGITGAGGGRVGAVLISPFIKPGTVSTKAYNHYALLRSVGDIFGVSYLGHAADGNTAAGTACDNSTQPCSFGTDVYTQVMPTFPARPAS